MSTAQEVIDRMMDREKERAYLLAVLDLWVKAQAQGIDTDTVRSFGFDGRLLTWEQKRQRFVGPWRREDKYIETFRTGRKRPRVFNYVRHHDGSRTVLNPMLEAVYEYDD